MLHRLLSALFLFAFGGLIAARGAGKLNLIVVVTDDQADWTLGCYGGADAVVPLAGEPARARADLEARLLAWMRSIDDPLLAPAPALAR